MVRKYYMHGAIATSFFLLIFISSLHAQPQLQVTPETVDFGEVEPYSPQIKVQKITVSNCGDGVLCWGVQADDGWLSVEGASSGMIDLPGGDQKYVQVSLGACGLCIVPQLQDEGKDPVGIHAGKFIVEQYAYDELTESCDPTLVMEQLEVNATMTIAEYNILRVEPNELDFGSLVVEGTFLIKNNGQGSMEWTATIPAGANWLTVNGGTSAGGTLGSKASEVITVRTDRAKQEGCTDQYSASIKIASANASPGESAVTVLMQRDMQPPLPSYPTPGDGVLDQPLYASLKWWEGESQEQLNGIINQSVYFSSDRSLVENESFGALVCDDLTVSYCDPNRGGGQLSPNTTYYWKVRAVDECNEGPPVYSDIWSFTTTAAMPQGPCFTSLALPLKGTEMNELRRVRDEMLAVTAEGRRLIELYYSPHAVEALVIAFFNPRARVAAYSLVKEVLPVLQLQCRGKKAVIDSGTVAQAADVLALFAHEASPEFKLILEAVREDLTHGSLIEQLGFVRRQ
jgi:hypothetical protein